ncbi:MAG: type II toxin-antitoxin system HipA family toxin [Algisphaera sp.]
MKRVMVKLQRGPEDLLTVGTLAEQNNRVYFEYDAAFLNTGINLSPFKLAAGPGLIEHTDLGFGPLPGLFDDSLPDGWGLLLMDRHFRQQSVDPRVVSPLDRLAYLGARTMGALTYHPPMDEGKEKKGETLDLFKLGCHAEKVLDGDAAEVLPVLMRAGGSPGGARPKVLVGIQGDRVISGDEDLSRDFLANGGEHWMVKFASKTEACDAGPVEYAYSLAAQEAGIEMPATRLFEVRQGRGVRRYFAVKRFDRFGGCDGGNRRRHVHTFANLVHVNFRIPSADYADLFKVTRALTRNHGDVLRLFKVMVFNVAMHNRDDHAKNFAFVLDDETGEWSLSPAYDLTFSTGPSGEHATTVMGEGKQPDREHCLKLAAQVGVGRSEAQRVFDKVNAAAALWPRFAQEAGCRAKVAGVIDKAIRRL